MDIAADFKKNTAEHVMHVERDDGLYRHLKFRKPGTYCYGFDVITWPGYLAITGDMGASTFCRLDDMFVFFRPSAAWQERAGEGELCVNVGYWSEKLVANDGVAREYRPEIFKAAVKRRFDDYFEDMELTPTQESAKAELWDQIESDVLHDEEHEYAARDSIYSFRNTSTEFPKFGFPDFWETQLTDYTFHLQWRLHAIAYAIQQYDALMTAKATAVTA